MRGAPLHLDPHTAYQQYDVEKGLGVSSLVLNRAIRDGKLKVARVGMSKQGVFMGAWLIAWLESEAAALAVAGEGGK